MGLCADGGAGSAEAEAEEVRDYRVKCLNNLAAAQLKLEQFAEALQTSRDVLTLEPNNVKALFRAGKVRAAAPRALWRGAASQTDTQASKVWLFANPCRAFKFTHTKNMFTEAHIGAVRVR